MDEQERVGYEVMRFPDIQDEYLRQDDGELARYDSLLEQAAEALSAQPPRVSEAIESCREAIGMRPSDTSGLRLLAAALIEDGESPESADAIFEEAAEQEPALTWQIMSALASFWEGRDRPDRAALAVERATELAPGDVRCWLLRGRYLARRERWVQLGRALEDAPEEVLQDSRLQELRDRVHIHSRIMISPLEMMKSVLTDSPMGAAVLRHVRDCPSCRHRVEREAEVPREAHNQLVPVGGWLGGEAGVTAQTEDGAVAIHVQLQIVRRTEDAIECNFELQEELPDGIWYIEAWAAGRELAVPLSVARVDAGTIILPPLVGGVATRPGQLQWRLHREQ